MRQFRLLTLLAGLLTLAAAFTISGCATGYTPKNAPPSFACVAEANLEKIVCPEAELTEFSCSFKRYEGVDTLHFKVGLKNKSNKDQRYRVHIFLDNGKAVGGLIPDLIKKGLVKPGQTATFVYPVMDMPMQPKSVILRVSAVTD